MSCSASWSCLHTAGRIQSRISVDIVCHWSLIEFLDCTLTKHGRLLSPKYYLDSIEPQRVIDNSWEMIVGIKLYYRGRRGGLMKVGKHIIVTPLTFCPSLTGLRDALLAITANLFCRGDLRLALL